MSVLRLHSEPLEVPIVSGEGEHKDSCDKCKLRDVCVRGCCNSHTSCIQESCYQECDDCGGGVQRFQGKNVPAVCSKAPLRELQLHQVRKGSYDFKKWKPIKLSRSSIVINQGSPGRIEGCPYWEDTAAVAVNLRHVWSTRGWFSKDMKDYMRVPKGVKLILITSTHDDVLERAHAADVQHSNFKALGFDYWQVIQFSDYADMSRYNNLWLGYRTLLTMEESGSSFCAHPPSGVDQARLTKDSPWVKMSEACPQIMVNWQYTSTKDAQGFSWRVGGLRRTLARLPKIKSVWFIGVVSANGVYNIKRNFSSYDCYFLSVNPWLAAFKGDEFSRWGKLKKSKLPRRELVLQNQRNYHEMVDYAINKACSESA